MPVADIVATPTGGVVLVLIPVLLAGREPVNVRKSAPIVPRCHSPHWFTSLRLSRSLSRAKNAPVGDAGSTMGRPFHGAGARERRSAFFENERSCAVSASR